MSSEVDVLLASLKGQYGWALAFTSWVTCLRLVFSFVNARLKEFAEQALPAEAAVPVCREFDRAAKLRGVPAT